MELQIEQLEEIFFDPKQGYSNARELFQKAKKSGLKLNYDEVKKWYEAQPVNQIFRKPQKVRQYNRIRSHFRFVWSFPLKTKKPDEIAPHIESVIKQIPNDHFRSIRYDQGSEFKGKVLDVMRKYDVKKFLNDPDAPNAKNSMAVVERFNYTLLQKIKKYMTKNDTVRYVDVLDDIISNYNNTVHSSIRHTPAKVFSGKEYPMQQGLNLKKTDKRKFNIGDSVRAIKVRKTFDKRGFVPTFTMTVYKITDIKNNKYVLNNGKSSWRSSIEATGGPALSRKSAS